jgi:hypothetical protein
MAEMLVMNGRIYLNEFDRPEGFSRVEARVEGAHLWIDATTEDGKTEVIHRYFDPLPQRNIYAATFIAYGRSADVTLFPDGGEVKVISNTRRGFAATRRFSRVGMFLTGIVNESLVNHDSSPVTSSTLEGTPLVPTHDLMPIDQASTEG